MSATEFIAILVLGLAAGLIVAIVATYYQLVWRWFNERVLRRKPRWRIEEVRCNKCMNSPEPGFLHHNTFDPVTEDVKALKVACDRCSKTGTMKVVVYRELENIPLEDVQGILAEGAVFGPWSEEEYERYLEDLEEVGKASE